MYDVLLQVLGSGAEEVIPAVGGALAIVLTVVFVDFIKDIFSGFFRG